MSHAIMIIYVDQVKAALQDFYECKYGSCMKNLAALQARVGLLFHFFGDGTDSFIASRIFASV